MRSPARRRPAPQRTGWGDGRWIFNGPLERDAVLGTMAPRSLMCRQRGGLVIANHRQKNSGRDMPDDY